MEVGEINSKDNNHLGGEKIKATGTYDCTDITSESRNKVNTIFLASVLG